MSEESIVVGDVKLERVAQPGFEEQWALIDVDCEVDISALNWSDWLALARKIVAREEQRVLPKPTVRCYGSVEMGDQV